MFIVELSDINEKNLKRICREAKISPEGLCEKLLINFIYEWDKANAYDDLRQCAYPAYLSLEAFQQNHIGYNVCDSRNAVLDDSCNNLLSKYLTEQCCTITNRRSV